MSVWIFWLVAALIGALVAGAMIAGLRRKAVTDTGADIRVYRAQLQSVDRDLSRGVIPEDEAERLRTEISRRVLAADRGGDAAASRGPVFGAVLLVATLGAADAVYARLGAPGYPDLPLAARIAAAEQFRATRPAQAVAEATEHPAPEADPEFLSLMDKLREAVAANPEDLRGWQLLARNEGALGNFKAAAAAQTKVVELGDGSASDRAALAEAMILSANGYVSPEAEAVLSDALARDSKQPLALYYSGLMMAQGGREDLAFRLWRAALENAPADAGYAGVIRAAMPDLAARAGVRWEEGPAATVGPTADQIEAMSALAPEARATAIEGMVAQLNDRLANRGGTADEWARLIAAYGVLGKQDRAAAVWSEARQLFTNEREAAIVRAAAEQAGVAE